MYGKSIKSRLEMALLSNEYHLDFDIQNRLFFRKRDEKLGIYFDFSTEENCTVGKFYIQPSLEKIRPDEIIYINQSTEITIPDYNSFDKNISLILEEATWQIEKQD